MIALTADSRMLGYGSLLAFSPVISHFVTTRRGGCSRGTYASFNCSPYCGDEAEHVLCNQQLLSEGMPRRPKEFVIPRQVHGAVCRLIDAGYTACSETGKKILLEGADALITREPGCCLCVSTADCVPVLLYDAGKRAVAAIHAGWRGAVSGVVSQTFDDMRKNFATMAEDVRACIGPAISVDAFEVGDEVYEAFREQRFDMKRIAVRHRKTGKWHIDLWEAVRLQLLGCGIPETHIELAGICTYRQHERFFSARRLGVESGRILSGIMLNE